MFLKHSLSLAPASGFVAFDGGGAVETDSYRVAEKAPFVVWQPAPSAVPAPLAADADVADVAGDLLQSSAWQPVAGRRARYVEGAVIVAICAYFLFGFAGIAGWI